ncbi:MAG: SRPBCC family protein [Ginsengibacter sp.]
MQKAKIFFIAVFTLFAFLCLITVFLPSGITISRSILIDAKVNKVAVQIEDFKNWKNWYPAFQNKNTRLYTSQRNDTSFAVLTDEKQQRLSLVLLQSVSRSIEVLVLKDNQNRQTYQFVLLPNAEGQTLLTWNVNITLAPYPWKKISGIFLDKISGPQYEAALLKLKRAVENTTH